MAIELRKQDIHVWRMRPHARPWPDEYHLAASDDAYLTIVHTVREAMSRFDACMIRIHCRPPTTHEFPGHDHLEHQWFSLLVLRCGAMAAEVVGDGERLMVSLPHEMIDEFVDNCEYQRTRPHGFIHGSFMQSLPLYFTPDFVGAE